MAKAKAKKKPTAKKKSVLDNTILLVEGGQYFSAKYNGKKIRGIVGTYDVWNDKTHTYDAHLALENAQAGDDNSCDDGEFPYKIRIQEGTAHTIAQAGITNLTILNDKRQKAIIDRDVMPQFDGQWSVAVKGDVFTFGCGAVELTKAQIESYLAFRKKVDAENMNGIGSEYVEDISIADLKAYIAYKEAVETKAGKDYKAVIDMVEGHIDEEDLNAISESEIKALFKYADHVNNV